MWEHIFRGALGVFILIGICFALSSQRKKINWRLVTSGLLLQFTLAILILKIPWFESIIAWVSSIFLVLIQFTEAGSRVLFGDLLDVGKYGLAFKLLPTIIFVSALTSALYYLGILQRVVYVFAWIMKRLMKLSGAESLATAANVFVGQTEAPLLVKPYIASMTRSEIMALMTGGMATIAGSVFAIYVALLGGDDPEQQRHFAKLLLTASMINAPAALLVAKILLPETETVNTQLKIPRDQLGSNFLDSISLGTSQGVKLAINVGAMLIVFIALIAMVNYFLGWTGSLMPIDSDSKTGLVDSWIQQASGGTFKHLSLEALAGFLFAPIAWAIGVSNGDSLEVGQLLGIKMVTNEFIAYTQMGELIHGDHLSDKTIFVTTFALCGFANFGSVGIQIAGIGGLAPEQRPTLVALGFKALIGGTIASLLTASIAGMFFS
ncbi:MAG: Na+ dependent nucleoside transporter [Verrucomicrobia bacterium]|nr:Na+ dependent nucleoside transporter [Verrucomicrobiota bacterium]